jgi:uncharacterized membrane protein
VIPPLWREQTYHPLLVHFPIGVLFAATLLYAVAALAARRERAPGLRAAGRVLLTVGVAFAWAAIYTGNLAEDVVNRVICDPTVTHQHEELAEYAAIAASLILAADLVAWRGELKTPAARWLKFWPPIASLLLLGAYGVLLRTAHLGASLVFQQSAGVYRPSESCKEFE